MNTLYNEDGTFNEHGKRLSNELRDCLDDLVDSYIHAGYPKHEVSHLLMTTTHVITIESRHRKLRSESLGQSEE